MTSKLTESYLGPVSFNVSVNHIGSILEAYLLLSRVDDSKIFFLELTLVPINYRRDKILIDRHSGAYVIVRTWISLNAKLFVPLVQDIT